MRRSPRAFALGAAGLHELHAPRLQVREPLGVGLGLPQLHAPVGILLPQVADVVSPVVGHWHRPQPLDLGAVLAVAGLGGLQRRDGLLGDVTVPRRILHPCQALP